MSGSRKPNSGALFANDRRRGEKDPSHKGQALIDGKEFWISAWENESRDGKRYFSLRFQPKMASEHEGGTQNPPARTRDEYDDDSGRPPF